MAVTFRIEQFEGPLDLLLQLVESEELDISNLSLATVADQFVGYVRAQQHIPLEELADFLVVAAKLIYLKSKLLLPSFVDAAMEEGPDLESQLRRYRTFVEASKRIDEMWKSGLRSYTREPRQAKQLTPRFVAPPGVTPAVLSDLMRRVISRLEPLLKLPLAAVERVVTIQEKISGLMKRVKDFAHTTFHEFVGSTATKSDMVVSFLAVLELVKQRFLLVNQNDLFHDIEIEAHPEAPEVNPLANSFI